MAGLRICIDSRRSAPTPATGVATYARVLGDTLAALGGRLEYLTDREPRTGPFATALTRWASATWPGGRRLEPGDWRDAPAWSAPDIFRRAQAHFDLHGRLLDLRCAAPPAVMHWTYPLPMRLAGSRNIYTVHDAIPLDQPDLTGVSRHRHRRLLECVGRSADLVVTVSEHSRAALMRWLPCPPERIVNTYQALDADVFAPELPPPAGLRPGGYFLFYGSVEPRKNIGRIIAAHRTSGTDQPLVIAGPDGWMAKRVLGDSLAEGRAPIRLPWLERQTLLALIRHARAVIFPSLAEGFGLPVLEAMALGTPVVTSNRGALAEIAGDGALLTPPDDTQEIARAITLLSHDEHLAERLRTAGSRRAADFSRAAYMRRLAQVYIELTHSAATGGASASRA